MRKKGKLPNPDRPNTQITDDATRLQELGKLLRLHRKSAGMTLDELSSRAGFNKGYLSRIENGKKAPPLATLSRLAACLGTDIGSLLPPFHEARQRNGVSVVRSAEKRPAILGGSTFGYDFQALSDASPTQALQPFLFSLSRRTNKNVLFRHDGEELLYVLRGRIKWQVGKQTFELEAGDTIHFDSRLPHRGHSVSATALALVVMFTPTGLDDHVA